MITTLRAALATCMLPGFYLSSIAIAVGLMVLRVSLPSVLPEDVAGLLVLVALAMLVAVLVATWRVARAALPPPYGLELPTARAPRLWDEVRRIAATVETWSRTRFAWSLRSTPE